MTSAVSDVLTPTKILLHIGAGASRGSVPPEFKSYREKTLDLSNDFKPDFVADMRDMKPVASEGIDALYSSHTIEHVHAHEVIPTLKEFHRVLKNDGALYLRTPDIQCIAAALNEGDIEKTIYKTKSGPINALDMLYGHSDSLAKGYFPMAHKTAFTAKTLANKLFAAGFRDIVITRYFTELHATGHRRANPVPTQNMIVKNRSNEFHKQF